MEEPLRFASMRTRVDGTEVAHRKGTVQDVHPWAPRLGQVWLYDVRFEPGRPTRVVHEYRVRETLDSGGTSYGTYVTRTGAAWAGSIGEARFRIQVPSHVRGVFVEPDDSGLRQTLALRDDDAGEYGEILLEAKDWVPRGDLEFGFTPWAGADVNEAHERAQVLQDQPPAGTAGCTRLHDLLIRGSLLGDPNDGTAAREPVEADLSSFIETGIGDARICRNFVFAVYGRRFKDDALNRYFYGEDGFVAGAWPFEPFEPNPRYSEAMLTASDWGIVALVDAVHQRVEDSAAREPSVDDDTAVTLSAPLEPATIRPSGEAGRAMEGITEQGSEAMTSAGSWVLQLLPPGLQTPLAAQILTALVGLVVLWVCVWLARSATTRYVQDSQSRYKMRKVLGIVGLLLGLLYLLGVFSQNLRNLTIALGVAGAALALALRSVAVGVSAWVAITFGGYFRVGDRVAVQGITGDVIDIGLTRVTLMECGNWVKGDQYSGRIVRVPNGTILEGPIFNYSQDFPFLWDELTVPILYGSDVGLACERVLEVAKQQVGEYGANAARGWQRVVKRYAIEDAEVRPMVFVHARDEGWAELTLRYVVDYKARRRTKTELYRAIYAAIEGTEGKVQLAASQLEIVGAPDLNVRITGQSAG